MQGLAPPTSFQIAQRTQIFDLLKYTDPNLLCGSKNKIALICINKECKAPSLHCLNQKCTFCQPHLQNNCTNFQFRALTSLMKKKYQNLKCYMQQLFKIETKILNIFEKKRIQMLQIIKYENLTKQEVFIVQNIFEKNSIKSKLKGSQISGLIQKLKNKNQAFRIDTQINIIKNNIKKVQSQIIELYDIAIDQIKNPSKVFTKVDSKILEHDAAGLGFILSELACPNQLKLLYRASEHDFSSQKFRKQCFAFPNRVTIIRTISNKVIACFPSEDVRYNQVLSVNFRQKYFHRRFNRLTHIGYSKEKYGPYYGKDFYLLDGNSQNLTKVFIDFPLRSHISQLEIQEPQGEQILQKIIGNRVNKFVQVNEYEVYQVINSTKLINEF